MTSHKFKQTVNVPATHAVAIAPDGGQDLVACIRGCACFLNPLTGKTFNTDGTPGPRVCSAAVLVGDAADQTIGFDGDLAIQLLRAFRIPTRVEAAQTKASNAVRYGDPQLAATTKDRDSVAGEIEDIKEMIAQVLISWVSSANDALMALPVAAAAALPAVAVRFLAPAAAAAGQPPPPPVPLKTAMARILSLTASLLGLSTISGYITADAPRWKAISAPAMEVGTDGKARLIAFYWNLLRNVLVLDKSNALPTEIYTIPDSVDAALAPIKNQTKIILHGPTASILRPAAILGTLRAASYDEASSLPTSKFWAAWRGALTAAAAACRKEMKGITITKTKSDGGGGGGGGGNGARRNAKSDDSDDDYTGDGNTDSSKRRRDGACPTCSKMHKGVCRYAKKDGDGQRQKQKDGGQSYKGKSRRDGRHG
jgi:hypothetical protein